MPTLKRFADVAETFCRVLENGDLPPTDQLQAVHRLLAELYVSALGLPHQDAALPGGEDPNEASDIVADTPESLRPDQPAVGVARIAEYLGPLAIYREFFDPHDCSGSEVTGTISDDLADIYADLTRGLLHWRAGERARALWEWRFNFEIHWGEHATSALRALYTACAWHNVAWPEPVRNA